MKIGCKPSWCLEDMLLFSKNAYFCTLFRTALRQSAGKELISWLFSLLSYFAMSVGPFIFVVFVLFCFCFIFF